MPQPEGPELVPEQNHHRKDGTQLDDHAEHGHELFTCIELDELLHKDHMTGGRDGQPLGDALHNAHQDGFQNFKNIGFLPARRTGARRFFVVFSFAFQYTILCGPAHEKSQNFTFICAWKYAILEPPDRQCTKLPPAHSEITRYDV